MAPCGVIDNEKFLNYKIVNDEIVFYPEKTDFFKNSYLYRKLSQIYLYHNQQIYISDYTYRIFKLFLKEMNEKIHQNYPDAKFIFVFYDGNPFAKNRDLKQMETEQFEIIDLKDILGDSFYENPKYKIPND